VLIAQILQGPAKVQQSTALRLADLCTVLLLLIYRYTTSTRWRRSHFASGFPQKWQNLSAPLYCQVIIWSSRAMFRRVFGVSVLLGMEMLGSDEAEDTSKLQMQQYLRSEWRSGTLCWICWGLWMVALLMLCLRKWVFGRKLNRF